MDGCGQCECTRPHFLSSVFVVRAILEFAWLQEIQKVEHCLLWSVYEACGGSVSTSKKNDTCGIPGRVVQSLVPQTVWTEPSHRFNDFVITLWGDHEWRQGLSSRWYITYHWHMFEIEIAVYTVMDRLIGLRPERSLFAEPDLPIQKYLPRRG
jgi:hypothetical protein